MRSLRFWVLGVGLAFAAHAAWADGPLVQVWKSPSCGCCDEWIDHLEDNGFEVEATDVEDVTPVKQAHHVPAALASCHTALVGGYVVEGHVPADDVKRLLAEAPPIVGIAVPGMPQGSPGMEGPKPERYHVVAFGKNAEFEVFATHGP